MLVPRVEAILAMTRDAKLGPFLLFGLGGTGAEEIDAADMLPVPVTRARLRERLTRSAVGQQVVERLGPHAGAAIDGLATVLEALAALAMEQAGTVAAAEVNPMIVTAEGRCVGVDGLIEIPAEGDSP